MSPSEPAIKLLRERYSETFALTEGKENQVHLFLIKVGLWSLVWTFTPKDTDSDQMKLQDALAFIETSIITKSPFLAMLDETIVRARERIENKVNEYQNR